MKKYVYIVLGILLFSLYFAPIRVQTRVQAKDTASDNYWTVYDSSKTDKVIFLKGDGVEIGDKYISGDNKLFEIVSVDENKKVGYAEFKENIVLPKYNVVPKNKNIASAKQSKTVGLYHTHNDESYLDKDGTDSVYGKGGIHDVGKKLKSEFEKLGVGVVYNEDLHLPHNSGAYTRSQVTASTILKNNNVQAIFDIHRDSTPRSEYITEVNGEKMTKIRMVIGSANANFEENKQFAYAIKGYADSAYPNFIKDIYIGKGNYNQQLSPRAMLFEFGCEKIEKDYALASTSVLAKTLDVVLYGSENASEESMSDVSLVGDNGEVSDSVVIQGIAYNSKANSNHTLFAILGAIGFYSLILGLLCVFNRDVRYKTGRFFSETFAGLFGKKKHRS